MKFIRYNSRFEAGKILADFVIKESDYFKAHILKERQQFFCFAIPNGGVPVTEGFCSKFNINYDILIVRKIKIPYNTEAGFGAVTTDGTILINEPLLNQLNLSENAVKNSIYITKEEISDRLKFYKKISISEDTYNKNIENKCIFILDDGLASGFTMLAALTMIKKYHPQKIFVVVPTAPLSTVKRVEEGVDGLFCPNIRDVRWFAVADAYKNWYDVPEAEVLELIIKSDYYISNIDET